MKIILTTLASLVLVLTAMLNVVTQGKAPPVVGSIVDGQAYIATTTGSGFPNHQVLMVGPGSLGSVVITGTTTSGGAFVLWDATSTTPTSIFGSTTLASFPTGAVPGTYQIDAQVKYGVLLDYTTTMPTTTITTRK